MIIIVNDEKLKKENRAKPLGGKILTRMFSLTPNDGKTLAVWISKDKFLVCIVENGDYHILSSFDTLEEAETEIQNIISALENGSPVYRVK